LDRRRFARGVDDVAVAVIGGFALDAGIGAVSEQLHQLDWIRRKLLGERPLARRRRRARLPEIVDMAALAASIESTTHVRLR
jgi:hypothetical protein